LPVFQGHELRIEVKDNKELLVTVCCPCLLTSSLCLKRG